MMVLVRVFDCIGGGRGWTRFMSGCPDAFFPFKEKRLEIDTHRCQSQYPVASKRLAYLQSVLAHASSVVPQFLGVKKFVSDVRNFTDYRTSSWSTRDQQVNAEYLEAILKREGRSFKLVLRVVGCVQKLGESDPMWMR